MGALRESLHFSGSHQGVHVPQGGGCALMNRSAKFQQIVRGVNEVTWALQDTPPPPPTVLLCALSLPLCPQVLDVPLTVKMRTGVQERVSLAHRLLPELRDWGVALVTVGVGQCGPVLESLWVSWSLALCLSLVPLCLPCPHLHTRLLHLPSSSRRLPPSSMAAPGSSATPGWLTGLTSSSVPRWPALCPCSVGAQSFQSHSPCCVSQLGRRGAHWVPGKPQY